MKSLKKKIILTLTLAFATTLCSSVLLFKPLNVQADVKTVPTGNVCVSEAAAVRVAEAKESGLRYQAYVNKDWYEGLENAQAGAIIVPESYVAEATKLNGEFSLTKLMNVVNEYDLPFQAVDTVALANYNEDYYSYALTLTKIKESNYAKDFVGIAYVRTTSEVESAESFTGQEGLIDGNYVIAYNPVNVRSIYQVAYNALTSGDDLGWQEAVLKGYADGVAVVSKTNEGITIANNDKVGYTSPYQVYGSNDEYIVTSVTANAKNIIYNGERQTSFPIKDDGVTIHATKTNGVENIDVNGNITLKGQETLANVNTGTLRTLNNSYFALNEKYGAGTYVEFEFTGNNMPQLCFFANEINEYMSYGTKDSTEVNNTGFLVLNGISATANGWNNAIKAYGAYRYGYGDANTTYIVNNTDTSMSQSELVSDKTYRLVIGTHVVSDKVYLEMFLFDKATNIKISSLDVSTGKAPTYFNESGDLNGYIIAYAGLKGGEDTTFKFNGVGLESDFDTVGVKTKNATVNVDGSITLKGLDTLTNANNGTVRLEENSYVSWQGNFGIGTYLEFEFIGNNMPQLCFFADEINGYMAYSSPTTTECVNDGLLVLNGFTATSSGWNNAIKAYGAHRYGYGNSAPSTYIVNKTNTGMSQSELVSDKTYRLVIGTHVVSDKVYLEMFLFDKATNIKISSLDVSTGKAPTYFDESGNPSGHIIAMAGLKGGEDTTFKVAKGPNTRDKFDIEGNN